jgi:hypothetical protein
MHVVEMIEAVKKTPVNIYIGVKNIEILQRNLFAYKCSIVLMLFTL